MTIEKNTYINTKDYTSRSNLVYSSTAKWLNIWKSINAID